ncbi:MAG: AraC family transcriptional regulator [Cytophagales bacterium]|nr:MAG: AraC family transcriptional regulator [Cytophagales bacterium]
METTRFAIKNMVCSRCVKVVTSELQKLGLSVVSVNLGNAEIEGNLSNYLADSVRIVLKENGFELIENRKSKIVEDIKTLLIKLIHTSQDDSSMRTNYSSYIAEKMGMDYTYLTTLFSEEEGITIEKYIILQKIERVKELLSYKELTLSEIAYQMDYSSVQHLSNQFRKVTGITPTKYKEQTEKYRKTLDRVG